MRWLAISALVLTSATCVREARAPMDAIPLEDELVEVDRAFARETKERGVDGWVDAFASDGRMFGDGSMIEGRAAIRGAMSELSKPDVSLEWEPLFAEVSASGDLGYTHGTYRRSAPGESGSPVVETGRYVTIWRRSETGDWKVVVDIGSAERPDAPNGAPRSE